MKIQVTAHCVAIWELLSLGQNPILFGSATHSQSTSTIPSPALLAGSKLSSWQLPRGLENKKKKKSIYCNGKKVRI